LGGWREKFYVLQYVELSDPDLFATIKYSLTGSKMYCTIKYINVENELDFSKIEGFEWDEGNINKNWKKHLVTNEEAEEVFINIPRVMLLDEKHSKFEKRYKVLGLTDKKRRLSITFTIRNYKFRIISARDMNKKERSKYEEKIQSYSKI